MGGEVRTECRFVFPAASVVCIYSTFFLESFFAVTPRTHIDTVPIKFPLSIPALALLLYHMLRRPEALCSHNSMPLPQVIHFKL